MSIKENYNYIISAWNNGDNSNDIYHMILYFFNKYPQLKEIPEVKEILERMGNNDSSQNIVEDFVYGERYSKLRKYLNSN